MDSDDDLLKLAESLGAELSRRGLTLATAESCTGGWIAKTLTDVAGSSGWFEYGFVTYSNRAKQDLLGVAGDTLRQHGAVSDPTVAEMARGALIRSGANVALAVSGVAGPDGGSPEKPVGTVWIAWAWADAAGTHGRTHEARFDGDRASVRRQSVTAALVGVLTLLPSLGGSAG